MSRARPLSQDLRKTPQASEQRGLPIAAPSPNIFMYIPSKKVTPGDRVYPFAGLAIDGPASVESARWRRDSGAFANIHLGDFTDILSAIRFVSEVINTYRVFFYELEVTDALANIRLMGVNVISRITVGSSKDVDRNKTFRPFADSIIAEDPSQISSIMYSIDGDVVVGKTGIERHVLFSGLHDGAQNSASLVDTGRDFESLEVRIGDIAVNTTDGSQGSITAIDGGTITAALSGGSGNDWDVGDTYNIVDGDTLDIIARGLEISMPSQGFSIVTLHVEDLSSNESSGDITVRTS